jgi:hypothetical protein
MVDFMVGMMVVMLGWGVCVFQPALEDGVQVWERVQ